VRGGRSTRNLYRRSPAPAGRIVTSPEKPGPAFATSSKDGLPPPLGAAGIGAVVDAVPGTPVIAIGGITASRAGELPGYGVAAISAISRDPAAGTIAMLRALASRGDFEELPVRDYGRGVDLGELRSGAGNSGVGGLW